LALNVLDKDRTPRVMSLREALAAWVEHQFVVLRRRSSIMTALGSSSVRMISITRSRLR
jgi:topoisomerase-4 subunit A